MTRKKKQIFILFKIEIAFKMHNQMVYSGFSSPSMIAVKLNG